MNLLISAVAPHRAALHLQLTTELVAAAAGTASEAAPADSMWQQAGASALQHAGAWASQLLRAVSEGNFPSGDGAPQTSSPDGEVSSVLSEL